MLYWTNGGCVRVKNNKKHAAHDRLKVCAVVAPTQIFPHRSNPLQKKPQRTAAWPSRDSFIQASSVVHRQHFDPPTSTLCRPTLSSAHQTVLVVGGSHSQQHNSDSLLSCCYCCCRRRLKDLPNLHSPVDGHLMRMSSVVNCPQGVS